ncbi:MAG TPA: hypothetical protein VL137_12285, partial [Polyangiaceae bacterium]|nr:hypothetical protein [Polyangiaceae bacterium]
ASTETGPRVLVVTTSRGTPDTCMDPFSNDTDPPRTLALQAVQAAWDMGIPTYVIGLLPPGETDVPFFQELAVAGAGGDPNALAYQVADMTALPSAYADVFSKLASCDFTLNGTVAADQAATGSVTIGGLPIAYDAQNGWQLVGGSTIHFTGTACDEAKTGVLDVAFPCGAFTSTQ